MAHNVLRAHDNRQHQRIEKMPPNMMARKLKRMHTGATRPACLLSDPEEFAQQLRSQFRCIDKLYPSGLMVQPREVRTDICRSDTFSINTVSFAIRDLQSGKAAGPSNVPIDLFKAVRWQISPILSTFFTFLLNTGVIPTSWKSAYIHPVPKKPAAANPCDFRPITLTDTLRKIYERALKTTVVRAIEPLSPEQCGFREGRSTLQQVAALQEDIIQFQHSHNRPATVVFLDIAKAYDTVDRDLLWQLCENAGFPIALLKTLKELFEGCTSTVVHKESESMPIAHESGLLQGSCLSPILYSLFIDGIIAAAKETGEDIRLYLFADDIAILAPNRSAMQAALDRCDDFSKRRHFRFSPTKCAAFKSDTEDTPLLLHNQVLPEVKEFKYLGVMISPLGISWEAHFSRVLDKQRRSMWRFHTLGFHPGGLLPRTRNMIFKLFIRPIGEYGLAIFPRRTAIISKLQVAQNDALRMMVGATANTPVAALHSLTDTPLVSDRQDILKSGFLAAAQEHPRDSPVRRALERSQQTLLRESCFADIASLQLYKKYAVYCRQMKDAPRRDTFACAKRGYQEACIDTLRLRCARRDAFPRCCNLFCDLSYRSPVVAARITRWVLSLLPPYPSMCLNCRQCPTSADHVTSCLRISIDNLVYQRKYLLAASCILEVEQNLLQM